MTRSEHAPCPPGMSLVIVGLLLACVLVGVALIRRPVNLSDPGSRPRLPVRRVFINQAPEEGFRLLPGIGPTLAGRIVDDRAIHGPFDTVDDLERVDGIGPKTVGRLSGHAVVDEDDGP